jgi:hypothetical protein
MAAIDFEDYENKDEPMIEEPDESEFGEDEPEETSDPDRDYVG